MDDSPSHHRPCFPLRLRTWLLLFAAGAAGAATIYAVDSRLRQTGQPSGRAAGGVSLLALDGTSVDPLVEGQAKAVVFIFTRTDCPIANRYAPEIRRLHGKFGPEGIVFRLVYPEASDSPAAIREHVAAFQYPFEAWRDPQHALVHQFGVAVTPEVVVFVPGDKSLVYRGRIDDLYGDFGRARPEPTTHELEDALIAVLSSRAVSVSRTTAIGCPIGDTPDQQ
jgi:hypothetical protein